MKKYLISAIALVTVSFVSQAQLLDIDFESSPLGQITTTPGSLYQTGAADDGDCSFPAWYVGTSNAATDCNTSCPGRSGHVYSDDVGCTIDKTMIIGSFVPTCSQINIQLYYEYDDYSSGADHLTIYLYNETTGLQEGANVVNTTGSDESGFININRNITPGNTYSLRFEYGGTFAYGATIDDILVTEVDPTASISQVCNADLTYDVSVNVTNLNGVASVRVNDGSSDLETGINATGITGGSPYTGHTGAKTFSVISEANAGCNVTQALTACTDCTNPPVATFTKSNCALDLSYSLDVNITSLGDASTVRVFDGTVNLETGINSTGVRTYNSLTGTKTYYVIDESAGSLICLDSITVTACTDCDILAASFSAQVCQSDLTYDITVSISSLATGQTVKITDGTTDLVTGINATGTFLIEDLTGAVTLEVEDEADASCIKSSASYLACDVCALATTPSDECINAPLINLSQAFYGSTNCSYNIEPDGTGSDVNGVDAHCGNIDNDSWLKFITADDSISLDWNVTGPAGCTSGIQLAVFDGDCSNRDAMVALACDNQTGGTGSSGTFDITGLNVNQEYFLYIDGFAGDLCDYNFVAQGGIAVLPPNDTCPDASLITCGYRDTASTILSTADDAPGTCGGLTAGQGTWYLFNGTDDSLIVTTDNPETNFDTELLVYTGSCGALTCLTSDNDGGTGTTSRVAFQTSTGTDYYIYVDGNGAAVGQYEISFACIDTGAVDFDCPGQLIGNDFELDKGANGGYTDYNNSVTDLDWVRGQNGTIPSNGTDYAYVIDNAGDDFEQHLSSPAIDLSDYCKFDIGLWYAVDITGANDKLRLTWWDGSGGTEATDFHYFKDFRTDQLTWAQFDTVYDRRTGTFGISDADWSAVHFEMTYQDNAALSGWAAVDYLCITPVQIISNVAVVADGSCSGNNAKFTVSFDVADGGGNYEVFDTLTGTVYGTITGAATDGSGVTLTAQINGPTSFSTATVNVRETGFTCSESSTPVTINIPTCPTPYCTTFLSHNFDAGNNGWTGSGFNLDNSSFTGNTSDHWNLATHGGYGTDEASTVTSGILDFTGYDSLTLSMDVRYNTESGYDGMALYYSLDGGTTWIIIGSNGDPTGTNWYNNTGIDGLNDSYVDVSADPDAWSGDNSGWETASIVLPAALENNPSVMFQVRFGSDSALDDDGVAFDNFQICGEALPPPCDADAGTWD